MFVKANLGLAPEKYLKIIREYLEKHKLAQLCDP